MNPDPEYIALRNSLIPEAEKWTNKLCGNKYRGENKKEKASWDARWSREFLKRVDFLYQEKMEELCFAEITESRNLISNVQNADTLIVSENGSIQQIKANSGFTFAGLDTGK